MLNSVTQMDPCKYVLCISFVCYHTSLPLRVYLVNFKENYIHLAIGADHITVRREF